MLSMAEDNQSAFSVCERKAICEIELLGYNNNKENKWKWGPQLREFKVSVMRVMMLM